MDSSHTADAVQPGEQAVNPAQTLVEPRDHPAHAEQRARPTRSDELWETVFSRDNVLRALQRVERNGGAPGADGMTVAELRPRLRTNWRTIRTQLDDGTYRPAPVRRVSIPKPDGGKRELGVPTVLDRLIQQAVAQALTPILDPTFSEYSFGFRPGRNAHQAVHAARGYVADGYVWVVDVDLDRFFDRVQHDVLMARVARRVSDKRVLRLIRRYLDAGIMVDGVKQPSAEGTPQGSPLSPLLANIMLDDLDRELEARGHRFVRYADDLRVYVRTERAAARTLGSVTGFLERRLRLKVNRVKSSTGHAAAAVVLGFGFYFSSAGVKIRIDPKALRRLRWRIRELTRRNRSIGMKRRISALNRFITGWCAYFAIAEMSSHLQDIDAWLRRRLRQVQWKEWKRPRTRIRNLRALGIRHRNAYMWGYTRKGYWRTAGSPILTQALPNTYWDTLGLTGFKRVYTRLRHA